MEKILQLISQFFHVNRITLLISDYLRSQVDLIKLEIRNEIARLFARAIVFVIILISIFLLLVFVSFSVATWFNLYYQNPYVGYLAVAGFYTLLVLSVFLFKRSIIRYVERKIQTRIQYPVE